MHGQKPVEPRQIKPARFLLRAVLGRLARAPQQALQLPSATAARSRRRADRARCPRASGPRAASREWPCRAARGRGKARWRRAGVAAWGLGIGGRMRPRKNARRPTRPRAQLSTLPNLYHSSPRPSSAKNEKGVKIRPRHHLRRRGRRLRFAGAQNPGLRARPH